MLSHLSPDHEKRGIMDLMSSDNPGFHSITMCISEAQYEQQKIKRDSEVLVDVSRLQPICSLCKQFEGDLGIKNRADGKPKVIEPVDQSEQMEEISDDNGSATLVFRDFAELDELANRGCQSCRVFRAAILYHHPSKDCHHLLMLDDGKVNVTHGQTRSKISALNISYPYIRSVEDFTNYDPEWPYGHPDDIYPGIFARSREPRERFKRLSVASVDVPVLPRLTPPDLSSLQYAEAIPLEEYNTTVLAAYTALLEAIRVLIASGEHAVVHKQPQVNHTIGRLQDDTRPFRACINARPDDPTAKTTLVRWFATCLSAHEGCAVGQGGKVPVKRRSESLRRWLSKPLSRHNTSGVKVGVDLPSRLLEISSAGRSSVLRLRETSGMHVSYACLSYCWGGIANNRCRLLLSNLPRLLESISLNELPATIRDAIEIARLMGISYLWIDALCIIQDDLKDWNTEAPRMGDYYSNAVLTIAATSSEHADHGLLRHRIAEYPDSSSTCVFGEMELMIPTPDIARNIHGAPIYTRAWTTQELYLSRRILHVTDAFIGWECRCLHSMEHFPNGLPTLDGPDTAAITGIFPDYDAKEFFRSKIVQGEAAYMAWRSLVRGYSAKVMSQERDILVAIAGLASAMQKGTDDEYLAGLWRGNLKNDILWHTDESRERPHSYTAPTWSWASTKSGDARQSHTSIDYLTVDSTSTYLANIDFCSVEGPDHSGDPRPYKGILGLTGKIAQMEFFLENVWASSSGCEVYARVPAFDAVGDIIFDTSDLVKSDRRHALYRGRATATPLYFLAITSKDKVPDYQCNHWIDPDLDNQLRQPKEAKARFESISSFSLVSKKQSRVMFERGRRFSMNDSTDPDVEIYDTSRVNMYGLRYVKMKPEWNQKTSVQDASLEHEPSVTRIVESEEEATAQPESEEPLLRDADEQPRMKQASADEGLPMMLGDLEDPDNHDPSQQSGLINLDDLYLPSMDDLKDEPYFTTDWSAKFREEAEAKQKAYDEASVTSSARTIRAYGHIPQRTSSLDRDDFRRWSKRFRKKHLAPHSAAHRYAERIEAQVLYVQGLMLERAEGETSDDGREVYRRVGIAKLEIRGERTQSFNEASETSIVII